MAAVLSSTNLLPLIVAPAISVDLKLWARATDGKDRWMAAAIAATIPWFVPFALFYLPKLMNTDGLVGRDVLGDVATIVAALGFLVCWIGFMRYSLFRVPQ
ncbi:hypothetical protein [Parvularcula sp. LCG005]|uniref:hypothetical protein n=1 Tax=Parvularcula sp. LCG005 TaxID=3078805 RepID=UPI002943F10E|nr:hypothetical protein [Parvularcula sp. LCG005]WOI53818.1 hypothetical protein RUI03_02180 [Parvularcula sp. LCG005]